MMEPKLANLSEKNTLDTQHGERILLRLTYISRYNTDNANIEVARILEQARRNNERNGISGVLVMNEDYFLQSIEGARPVINELLAKLIKDNRHFSFQIVDCREVEQQRWDKWSMKYLTPSDENKEYMQKFSASNEFNPYLMSTSQIMSFIETLAKLQEQRASEEK